MPLGGEVVEHRGRVDHELALRRVGGEEHAVSRFQAASTPDEGG